ncbi:MAG TPA: hypothetical protein VM871_05120 [Flavisolibacter sp.]|nr:hypothetical protein [Flavisolibacter sp.]
MKKFLVWTALFLLPLLALAVVADWWLTHRFRQFDQGNYSVWNDLLDGKVNADVVIYGTSRADVHFNPKVIEDSLGLSAYNLGINGHNFYMEYLRHTLLLKHNKKPKLIILSVDNVMLDKRENLYGKEQFSPYLSNADIAAATKTYEGYNRFDYLLPLVRYVPLKNPLTHIREGNYSSTENSPWYKGFHPHEGGWNNDFEVAVSKRKVFVQRFDSGTLKLFDRFLQEMKQASIPVIFVYSPEYIEGQKFVTNRNEVFEKLNFFASKYNLPFLDYSADTLCLSKKYFFNSQHLNEHGVITFMGKFVKDLKPLLKQAGIRQDSLLRN